MTSPDAPGPGPQRSVARIAEQSLDEHAVLPLAVQAAVSRLDPYLVEPGSPMCGEARRVGGEDAAGELVEALALRDGGDLLGAARGRPPVRAPTRPRRRRVRRRPRRRSGRSTALTRAQPTTRAVAIGRDDEGQGRPRTSRGRPRASVHSSRTSPGGPRCPGCRSRRWRLHRAGWPAGARRSPPCAQPAGTGSTASDASAPARSAIASGTSR